MLIPLKNYITHLKIKSVLEHLHFLVPFLLILIGNRRLAYRLLLIEQRGQFPFYASPERGLADVVIWYVLLGVGAGCSRFGWRGVYGLRLVCKEFCGQPVVFVAAIVFS